MRAACEELLEGPMLLAGVHHAITIDDSLRAARRGVPVVPGPVNMDKVRNRL